MQEEHGATTMDGSVSKETAVLCRWRSEIREHVVSNKLNRVKHIHRKKTKLTLRASALRRHLPIRLRRSRFER